jgi:hypothetical protein
MSDGAEVSTEMPVLDADPWFVTAPSRGNLVLIE